MSSMAFLLAAAVACSPLANGIPKTNFKPTIANLMHSQTLIAQKYGGSDPHGPDPHGPDPHDEQHDDKLPANGPNPAQAPDDVYGGQYNNSRHPY